MNVKTMPISELTQTVANFYFPPTKELTVQEGWEEVRKFFAEDKNEALKIDALMKQLKRDRKFRTPIMLSEMDGYEFSENQQVENVEQVVGNGTHRTVAYILLAEEENLPDFPVEYYEYEDGESWFKEEDFKYYETSVEVPEEYTTDERMFDVMDILTVSKPTSNDEWLEVELVSAKKNKLLLFWGNPKRNPFSVEEAEQLIVEALIFNDIIEDASETKIATTFEEV